LQYRVVSIVWAGPLRSTETFSVTALSLVVIASAAVPGAAGHQPNSLVCEI
jgi:hypothetical protein